MFFVPLQNNRQNDDDDNDDDQQNQRDTQTPPPPSLDQSAERRDFFKTVVYARPVVDFLCDSFPEVLCISHVNHAFRQAVFVYPRTIWQTLVSQTIIPNNNRNNQKSNLKFVANKLINISTPASLSVFYALLKFGRIDASRFYAAFNSDIVVTTLEETEKRRHTNRRAVRHAPARSTERLPIKRTLLHAAVATGSLQLVRYAVENCGCHVDEVMPDEVTTAMILAAQSGHLRILKFLSQRGARSGGSALHAAVKFCKTNQLETVQCLLAPPISVDVNAPNELGWPPLHVAVETANVAVVRELLSHPECNSNATVSKGNSRGDTASSQCPLVLALSQNVLKNPTSLVRALLEGGSDQELVFQFDEGWNGTHTVAPRESVLCFCARIGSPAIELLIDHIVQHCAKNNNRQRSDPLKQILNQHCQFYNSGWDLVVLTPLAAAFYAGKFDAAKALIKAGASLEFKTKDFNSLREVAIKMRRPKMLELLPPEDNAAAASSSP